MAFNGFEMEIAATGDRKMVGAGRATAAGHAWKRLSDRPHASVGRSAGAGRLTHRCPARDVPVLVAGVEGDVL